MRGRTLLGALVVCWAGSLAACAMAPPAADPDLADPPAWAQARARRDAAAALALDDGMRRYLDEQVRPALRGGDPRDALVEVLYRPGALRLDYDDSRTRTAGEAFAQRSGNCLSLVLMGAAFARALDIPVRFQAVAVPAVSSRLGGLQFSSRHVNLTLDAPAGAARLGPLRSVTVDFLPPEELRRQRSRDVSEPLLLAMFLNNRAAESLAEGVPVLAQAYAQEALRLAPTYSAARNTLALAWLHQGDAARARAALERVLQREPANLQALANLVGVLNRVGDHTASAEAARRLAEQEPVAPFEWLDRAMALLLAGDAAQAKLLLQRELARDADYHETHFWLAVAHARLGERAAAVAQLREALAAGTSAATRERYAAKLQALRAAEE